MIDQLREGVSRTGGSVLVVDDGTVGACDQGRSLLGVAARWSVPDEPPPPPGPWSGVALLVRDRQSLRRVISVLPALGRSERVWCWIEDCGGWAPTPVLRPEWPRLKDMTVRTAGAGFAFLEFAATAPVREVLIGIACGSSTQRAMWAGGPVLGGPRAVIGRWSHGSPNSVPAEDVSEALDAFPMPPDAFLAEDSGPTSGEASQPHPTTGRRVERIALGPDVSWADLGSVTTPLTAWAKTRPFTDLSVDPVDEHVINPIGFERDWVEGVVAVEPGLRSLNEVVVRLRSGIRHINVRAGLKDSDVKALRSVQGLELLWRGGHGPQSYARLVAGLAMAGVPIARTRVPRWALSLLDPDLVRELESPARLGDRLTREERSVRLRRASLNAHSRRGWRRRLARAHGLPEPRDPAVSVLLATRRPEMVPFALRQVVKQQSMSGEVVLATHGFEADAAIRGALDDCPAWELRVIAQPADTPFGEVLNRAAAQASGGLLVKMDDDDWYGPNFIADLLLARGYSGADVVGMPAEFFFLEQLWRTVRRPDFTERFADRVSGSHHHDRPVDARRRRRVPPGPTGGRQRTDGRGP